MNELPILFSGSMVSPILDDTKTQTRRALRVQPPEWVKVWNGNNGVEHFFFDRDEDDEGGQHWPSYDKGLRCPYGQSGDRLWVRETFFAWGYWETRFSEKKGRDEWRFIDITLESAKHYRYAATDKGDSSHQRRSSSTPRWWKRPAIHMPRGASRITLEITAVRVERLQDISPADCEAEGVQRLPLQEDEPNPWYTADVGAGPVLHSRSTIGAYHKLWDQINGPGSWDANPWVWVVEFRRLVA